MKPVNNYVILEPVETDKGALEYTDKSVPAIGTVKATDSKKVKIGQKVFFKRWNKTDIIDSKDVAVEEKDIIFIYE